MPALVGLRVLSGGRKTSRSPGERTRTRRVALVCTPFHTISLPSIALGTLAPILRNAGHDVDVHYLNLDFAAHVGVERYEEMCLYPAWLRLLGEWLFADESIAPGSASVARYRAYLETHRWRDRAPELERLGLERLKRHADRAVDRWFSARDWGDYDVVGFNAMFQQINPSLRLGYRIKRAFPHVRVVLGGSAMEVPMGQPVLDRHDWLDAVFSGYAEQTLPEYVSALPRRVSRVITQRAAAEMDELPIPDYDAFFADVRRNGLAGAAEFRVPIETSRGCWWGERQHCTFCGLNALDMKQRNKSADRVFDEIVRQSRYGLPFFATDNILPLGFFKDLFERLIADRVPFDTFYETKSNLTLAQLRTLRDVGVTWIQPGIESLSTPILKNMKKGVTAAQNLWLLRAAEELELGVAWSILYGFPGEDPAEYATMTRLLPALSHLPPPLRPAPVLLERYSPLFDGADANGFSAVRPTEAHRAAFGDAPRLDDRAYVFDFEYDDGRKPDDYAEALNRAVATWIDARRRLLSPRCEIFDVGPWRLVFDSRAERRVGRGRPAVHLLTAAERELVRLTAELTDERKLRASWSLEEPIDRALGSFIERRWLVRIDGRLVRVLMYRRAPTIGAELRRAVKSGVTRALRALGRAPALLRARIDSYDRMV